MMAMTGVCPFDPSVPGVQVVIGEEGESVGEGWRDRRWTYRKNERKEYISALCVALTFNESEGAVFQGPTWEAFCVQIAHFFDLKGTYYYKIIQFKYEFED